MSLCINPSCTQPQNRDDELFCLSILRRLFSCKWWVLLAVLGVTIGPVLGVWMALYLGSEFTGAISVAISVGGAVFGASLGVMQWLVLRQQSFRANWWIVSNAVGVMVVWHGIWSKNIVLATVACTVCSAITGSVLVCLMRKPVIQT